MKNQLFYLFLVLLISACQENELINATGNLDIIPLPAQITQSEGFFEISKNTVIVDNGTTSEAQLLNDYLKNNNGLELAIVRSKPDANYIELSSVVFDTIGMEESYFLNVNNESISIQGGPAGVFYGTQSLQQILPNKKVDVVKIPIVKIEDKPRFAYRGMHLDVCRHMFPVEFIKKYIDQLAKHKMNTFHWHLTEDQGWRIEIKKYPKLQSIAAYRKETKIGHYSDQPHQYDGKKYGGFYTQEEVKDIVAYAQARHITVIPEIEMPGHSLAALSAYPELACTDAFLEDVLTEVMALFPSKYIHIGGDECPKTRWEESAFCQKLMKEQGLHDEHELQSYFIQRMEKFINSKGKQIIGWDEILEGGLAPNATVMSWRGMQGGIEAAKAGHDVIMTPGSHCYFDHYQSQSPDEPVAIGGFTSLEKVYSFEPVPEELSEEEAKHILGAQANVWTEYIPTSEHVEYMAFPRICALAEVNWSAKSSRDWEGFSQRMLTHFERLKSWDINYADHFFDVKGEVNEIDGGVSISLSTNTENDIIYTTNGSAPNASSPQYQAPIEINETGIFKAATLLANGKVGRIFKVDYKKHKAVGQTISLKYPPSESYPGEKGAKTLIDGLPGNGKFNGKDWLGFNENHVEAIITFEQVTDITKIQFGSTSSNGAWVHFPKGAKVYNNESNQLLYEEQFVNPDKGGHKLYELPVKAGTLAKQLRVEIYPETNIPEGLPGAGKQGWLFVDEITVE